MIIKDLAAFTKEAFATIEAQVTETDRICLQRLLPGDSARQAILTAELKKARADLQLAVIEGIRQITKEFNGQGQVFEAELRQMAVQHQKTLGQIKSTLQADMRKMFALLSDVSKGVYVDIPASMKVITEESCSEVEVHDQAREDYLERRRAVMSDLVEAKRVFLEGVDRIMTRYYEDYSEILQDTLQEFGL